MNNILGHKPLFLDRTLLCGMRNPIMFVQLASRSGFPVGIMREISFRSIA
jgi:hypothetical protein